MTQQTLTFCINLPAGEAFKALEWYKEIFGAVVEQEYKSDSGTQLYHGNVRFGNILIFCSEQGVMPGMESPRSLGGSHISISYYTPDPDEVHKKAVAAGAEEVSPVADQEWGMRSGSIRDPFGYKWSIYKNL